MVDNVERAVLTMMGDGNFNDDDQGKVEGLEFFANNNKAQLWLIVQFFLSFLPRRSQGRILSYGPGFRDRGI